MSIYIASIETGNVCKLYGEDGTGLVQNIYHAYQHLNAIEIYIKDHLDHHYDSDEILNVYIDNQQLLKLSVRAPKEEKLRANYGPSMQQKFAELYTIIEELLGD